MMIARTFAAALALGIMAVALGQGTPGAAEIAFLNLLDDDDYQQKSKLDYTDEHKAVMVIAGECGNHEFKSSYTDGDGSHIEGDPSASCDAGVDGCSIQLVMVPKYAAAAKALGQDPVDAYQMCLPDDFQKRAAAAGWSLDKYYSKRAICSGYTGELSDAEEAAGETFTYTRENHESCVAAGCGSEPNPTKWDGTLGSGYCYGQSHQGLTSNAAAKEAAVKQAEKNAADAQTVVDAFQKAKTTACAASATSAECTEAGKSLEDALVTQNNAKSALNAAENYDLDSATGVTASLVVVVLSAIATFF